MGGGPASDSRRTSRLLRLLPSRPDRIHNLLSRETNGATIERVIMPQISRHSDIDFDLRAAHPRPGRQTYWVVGSGPRSGREISPASLNDRPVRAPSSDNLPDISHCRV